MCLQSRRARHRLDRGPVKGTSGTIIDTRRVALGLKGRSSAVDGELPDLTGAVVRGVDVSVGGRIPGAPGVGRDGAVTGDVGEQFGRLVKRHQVCLTLAEAARHGVQEVGRRRKSDPVDD